jgi:hypothetical protein
MAELSLWMLGSFASVVAAGAFQLSSLRLRRFPNPFVSALGGVASALVFFGSLLLIRHGLRFDVTICLAFGMVILVAAGWPMVGAKVDLTNGWSDRGP